MATFDEVAEFIREQTSYRATLTRATSLQSDLGVFGDDMDDLLTAYSERFEVDLSGSVWYFHTGEEGISIGGLFVAPPYRRVSEIPITVGMLHEFATLGRWAVAYPDHEILRFRGDLLIDQVFAVLMLLFGLGSLVLWLGGG